MAKGIEIDIAANTRDFQKGVQDVDKELSNVADSLDGLADETKDSSRASLKEVDKLESGFKSLADTAQRETKAGGDAMGRNFKAGTSSAKSDLAELGNEAKVNAAETFSSFDGSASSFADGIQGTLGGIVSSLGPIGAAAGAAGALGIGLIMSATDKAGTQTEEYKAKVAELGQEFIDAGGVSETSLDYMVDKLKEMATETDDSKDNLKELRTSADKTGGSFDDLAQAYAGNADALDDQIDYLKDVVEANDEAGASATRFSGKGSWAARKRKEAAEGQIKDLEKVRKSTEEAAEAEQLWLESGGAEIEAKASQIGSIQDAVDDAAGSWEDYQDKESGALDPTAYLAGVTARIAAGNDYADNMATAQEKLSPEAYQYLVDQGIDFAPMLSSILSSGLVDQFNTTFTEAAAAGNTAVEQGVSGEVKVTAQVDADTTSADNAIEVTAGTDAKAEVKVTADTSKADAAIKASAEVKRTATIDVDASLTAAEKAMSNFMNKTRTVTVTAVVKDRNGKVVD